MARPQNRLVYARPSWQEGIARLMDFGGALDAYAPISRPKAKGTAALSQAWQTIGRTLRQTIETESHVP